MPAPQADPEHEPETAPARSPVPVADCHQPLSLTDDLAEFDKSIDELCPADGIEFTGADFRKLLCPIVYLFICSDEVLYVGMGRNGIERPAAADHGAREARLRAHKVLIYPCDSVEQSARLERFLIQKLQPEYNLRMNPVRTREAREVRAILANVPIFAEKRKNALVTAAGEKIAEGKIQ